ncbi:hypothetical protein PLANPX_0217 [Lacipirellula parvula]|uniref:Uncharacterized protein n=1 Tax=Lacipirellula parvula TaxID=2650471 RepID=A0A5K7X2P1_9BACT|nr:hypothetical protein PLANPX_0217 [Lacipirellula parvula]
MVKLSEATPRAEPIFDNPPPSRTLQRRAGAQAGKLDVAWSPLMSPHDSTRQARFAATRFKPTL